MDEWFYLDHVEVFISSLHLRLEFVGIYEPIRLDALKTRLKHSHMKFVTFSND